MIIARIESLVLGKGMDDAIKRAEAYIHSGADGIMIHSKEEDPDEIIKFCNIYNLQRSSYYTLHYRSISWSCVLALSE